ncbi:MAG: hypothetical protein LLG42_15675 [Chloroflexi bacterium]|nr:hypothetical protein [Chloroflexota bacterium]
MPPQFPINSTNQLVQSAKSDQHTLFEIGRQIQALLQKFNLSVQGSFSAGGVQGLEQLTTASGYEIMQKKYSNWINRQVVALNLASCEFLSFNLTADQNHAKAFTFEKWVFVYADGKTVPTAGSVDGYDLRQVDGQWRVDSARTYAEAAATEVIR